ncbi:MAG: hypothetical protein ACOH2A_11645 [Sphingobacteriaceae bacterium]
MKRFLFISCAIFLAVSSLTSCKKDKKDNVDPLAAEKTMLFRTIWHTTLEQYSYTDESNANLLTQTTAAGTQYAFFADGSVKITNKKSEVTSGTYYLYKKGNDKYLEIAVNGSKETYLLTKLETQKMSWSQVKTNQPYLINGSQKVAPKLTTVFNFDCACGE